MTLRGLLRQGHGVGGYLLFLSALGAVSPKRQALGATPSAAIAKPADSAAKRGFWIGPPGPGRPRTSARKGASRNGCLTELGFCRPAVGPSGASGRRDPAGNRTGPSRAYPEPPSCGSIWQNGTPRVADGQSWWRPKQLVAKVAGARNPSLTPPSQTPDSGQPSSPTAYPRPPALPRAPPA